MMRLKTCHNENNAFSRKLRFCISAEKFIDLNNHNSQIRLDYKITKMSICEKDI